MSKPISTRCKECGVPLHPSKWQEGEEYCSPKCTEQADLKIQEDFNKMLKRGTPHG